MKVSDFAIFKKQHILRQVGDHFFLIPLHKNPILVKSLNSTAAIFWKLLDKDDNLETASNKVASYFQIDKDLAKNDLKMFLHDLVTAQKTNITESVDSTTSNTSHAPISGTFEITGKCNLQCFHCYVSSERMNTDLSFIQIKKIIDNLVDNGCLLLLLTGGECTSRSDFAKIYTYVRKKGIIPSINTNATLVDKKLLSLFKKYPPKRIKVSLYGPTAVIHDKVTKVGGSFDRIIRNSLLLKKAGLNIVFSGLIFKENSSIEPDLKQFTATLGIPIKITRGLVPTIDHHSDHLCQLDKNSTPVDQKIKSLHFDKEGIYQCNAGESSFHINSLGQLSLCMMERQDLISLNDQSFSAAWERLGKLRKSRLSIPKKCRDCADVESCNFCPVIYNLFKSSGVLNIYCSKT